MRVVVFFLLPLAAWAQGSIPVILGRPVALFPAAADAAGQKVAFGAAVSPDGATSPTADVYVVSSDGSGLRRLTRFSADLISPQGANAVVISADGSRIAYTALAAARNEEVHVVDPLTGADKAVAVDKEGCIQPLCANCFFYCVNTPHLAPDGSKVLYSVRRQQPFFLVNADGRGLTRLPIFSGTLAPAPQRVVSSN